MDSAFFNEDIITVLEESNVEFTLSVPFARFAELKSLIENRKRWQKYNDEISYFEDEWKPKCWNNCSRFIFIRIYLFANIMAYNLNKELQMSCNEKQ